MVIRPSSPTTAAHARGSSGHAARRWLTRRPDTTASQPSKSDSSRSTRVARADVGACFGEEQHIAGEHLLGLDCGRERVVLHGHELSGVDAVRSGPGQDDGDDVADEADDLVCQEGSRHPLVETRERWWMVRAQANVLCREHLSARPGESFRHVDVQDARVGIRRTDERHVERIREIDVLDVEPLAEEEPRILAPENTLAHDPTHGRSLFTCL